MNEYYIKRINLAVDYIEANINSKITTKDLAKISSFSEFHFHRIFKLITSETVNQYIKRLKMGKSFRDLTIGNDSVTQTAFKYGYNSSANFTRDFTLFYNTNPSVKKREKVKQMIIPDLNDISLVFDTIKEIPNIKIYYSRIYTGYDTGEIIDAFNHLFSVAKKYNLNNNDLNYIGIGYDDLDFTDPDRCRYDAGFTLVNKDSTNFDTNELNSKILTPGLCSIYTFKGNISNYTLIWDYIIKSMILSSEYTPSDEPHFEMYFDDHTKFYLPVKKIQ